MSALLLLDKPENMTSFSAVAYVRRIVGIKKAGHTGTLDPMATGVLPILLGGATRFAEFLPSHDKAYLAGMQLGVTTDTLDITGTVLEERPVNVTRADIEQALGQFRGKIMQVPPMYSAKSQGGQRLYELARRGVEVEREARAVEIYKLELLNDTQIYVECSAGTYIRSLIDDLGRLLGCGACMSSLRRTKANGFELSQCVTLEQFVPRKGTCESFGFHPRGFVMLDDALSAYPAIEITPAQAVRFRNGGALDLARLYGLGEGELHRVYCEDKFLGLGRVQGQELAVARLLVE
ncbi:MAG: tRNA pseudouridine(55) synthase TruB [Firmicutes bacterium]|nr:tRNA pseudouridine(55) synthase TruB [Bacillota bacterium]